MKASYKIHLGMVVNRMCIGEQVPFALIGGDKAAARAGHLTLAAPGKTAGTKQDGKHDGKHYRATMKELRFLPSARLFYQVLDASLQHRDLHGVRHMGTSAPHL